MKRGYGGVAIIWNKDIDDNIKVTPDGGNRIQVIHIQQEQQPICLINVYMPSNSNNSDMEYKDTLAQLDEIMIKYEDTHQIMMCGDMNGSLHRHTTPHDKIFKTYCMERDLGATEKCPTKPTFYHHNGLSVGQIDYFLLEKKQTAEKQSTRGQYI